MKKKFWNRLFVLLLTLPVATGCVQRGEDEEESEIASKAPVTITHIRIGNMNDVAELTATSSFQVRSVVQAPVNGYVEKCTVNPGDRVSRGQLIFQVRTKEAEALLKDTASAVTFSGLIGVKASLDGIVISIDHSKGDYVQEGNPLCSLVLPESLVFLLDVPFELKQFIHTGSYCDLLLPGNEKIRALIKTSLPSVAGASQTQKVILQPETRSFLPENLIARVVIVKNIRKNTVILPKSCILSDEIMKNFWIMKLTSDSVAVKTPVVTGLVHDDSVEIVSPVLTPADLILSSGNYGLADTAKVRVMNKADER